MIFSKQLLFSDGQAITADAVSTNVVDLRAIGQAYGAAAAITRDIGKGMRIPIRVQVTETFDALTSLEFQIITSAAANMGSPTILARSGAVLLASLTAGYVWNWETLPRGPYLRYLALYYDVTGTGPAVGKITAGITMGNQSSGE